MPQSVATTTEAANSQSESMYADPDSDVGNWVRLEEHLIHVARSTTELADSLALDSYQRDVLKRAASWHDVGKAHAVFQDLLVKPALEADDLEDPPMDAIWVKSNHRRGRAARPYFRHELASALAFRQFVEDSPTHRLIAYLIAAHHGKIRMSIRSLPNEVEPTIASAQGLFARGIWHGDELPEVTVPGEGKVGPLTLDLTPMRLGVNSWLEATLSLRDDPQVGPFRLAWLETLLRLADQRASAAESQRVHLSAIMKEEI